MARLTSPQGATVEVRDEKAEELLRRGFSGESKAPAKKAASSKSSKK
jgi:hypothetical protein